VSDSQEKLPFEIEPNWPAILLVDSVVLAGCALAWYLLSGVGGDLTVKLAAGLVLLTGVVYVFVSQYAQLTIQFSDDGIRRAAWIGKTYWEWHELEQIDSNSAGFDLLFSDGARIRVLRSLIANDADLKKLLESRSSTVN
jgi:hypothetical protein